MTWCDKAAVVAVAMLAIAVHAGGLDAAATLLIATILGITVCWSQKNAELRIDLITPETIDQLVRPSGRPPGDPMVSVPMHCKMTAANAEEVVSQPPGNEYEGTLSYVRDFLAKPHCSLGRQGPVCPFVPKALQLRSVSFGLVRTGAIPRHTLRATITKRIVDFIPRFLQLAPSAGKLRQFKAVVLIFPDVVLEDAHDVIDGAQADARPHFVARG